MSKVLLITGAGRGIGAATAKLAAQQGYDVAINYLRDDKAAGAVIAAVKAAGRRGIAIKGDLGREDDIARMFETVDKELGRLTHLVYNAGITGGYGRLEAADPAMMREVLELNVLGALLSREGRDPAHVGQAGRGRRRDRAGLLDGGEPRQPRANMSGTRPRRARSTP